MSNSSGIEYFKYRILKAPTFRFPCWQGWILIDRDGTPYQYGTGSFESAIQYLDVLLRAKRA
jgi:hypothetical protein